MAERIATWVIISFGYGITLWLIKKWLYDLKVEVSLVKENQISCQLALPKDYATVKGVEKMGAKVDHVVADTEYLKGKYNGGTK